MADAGEQPQAESPGVQTDGGMGKYSVKRICTCRIADALPCVLCVHISSLLDGVLCL